MRLRVTSRNGAIAFEGVVPGPPRVGEHLLLRDRSDRSDVLTRVLEVCWVLTSPERVEAVEVVVEVVAEVEREATSLEGESTRDRVDGSADTLADGAELVRRFRRLLDPDLGVASPEEVAALSEYLSRSDALLDAVQRWRSRERT